MVCSPRLDNLSRILERFPVNRYFASSFSAAATLPAMAVPELPRSDISRILEVFPVSTALAMSLRAAAFAAARTLGVRTSLERCQDVWVVAGQAGDQVGGGAATWTLEKRTVSTFFLALLRPSTRNLLVTHGGCRGTTAPDHHHVWASVLGSGHDKA